MGHTKRTNTKIFGGLGYAKSINHDHAMQLSHKPERGFAVATCPIIFDPNICCLSDFELAKYYNSTSNILLTRSKVMSMRKIILCQMFSGFDSPEIIW